jgi:hypothetical protein
MKAIAQTKNNTYFELIEAMQQPGCPVCRRVDVSVRQYVDVFFYENITNVERRGEIRAARGYCSVHGAMLAGHSRMLGTAIIQHDVLNDVLRGIDKVLPNDERERTRDDAKSKGSTLRLLPSRLRNGLLSAVRPRRNCPLCDYERDQEHILLRTLINEMHEPPMRAAFERSSGLCLPHFQIALQSSGVNEDGLRIVARIERNLLESLKAELDEYLKRSNGSYEYEGMGKEADAPGRAVKTVSGRVFGRR